jgi:hypothetical protein
VSGVLRSFLTGNNNNNRRKENRGTVRRWVLQSSSSLDKGAMSQVVLIQSEGKENHYAIEPCTEIEIGP